MKESLADDIATTISFQSTEKKTVRSPTSAFSSPARRFDPNIKHAIDRLLKLKQETQLHTVKHLSCKKETINMLNRIGFPQAKKLKRQRYTMMKHELKEYLEKETSVLMHYSRPDTTVSLLDDFRADSEDQRRGLKIKVPTLHHRSLHRSEASSPIKKATPLSVKKNSL